MSENLNIWGQEGCILPNGEPCKACCIGLVVRGKLKGRTIDKPELEECEELLPKSNGVGWCGSYGDRPAVCENYNCGDSTPQVQRYLITVAENKALVTQDEADVAREGVDAREFAASLLNEF